MKVVQGTINCKEAKSIPVGSVIFIYVYKEDKVVGHQTLASVEHFPFDYKVEIEDEDYAAPGLSIKVMIDNGENTLFLNGSGSTDIRENQVLDKLDIELNANPISS